MPPCGAGLATLPPVRRILAIVLLALLPLQFSWAAVASYCEHEASVGAGHLGHHEHPQHGAAPVDVDNDHSDDPAAGSPDVDCGHCHGHSTGLPALPEGLPAGVSTVAPRASADEAGGAHAPARPERPQWAPLA